MGYGLLTLRNDECYVLNDVAPKVRVRAGQAGPPAHGGDVVHDVHVRNVAERRSQEGGPVATIGAGTGLGECFLSQDPKTGQYVCWATEVRMPRGCSVSVCLT
jgi:hypothetical protein